ncbi:MAG: hypothetical protein RLZZ58_602 [Pseudomonadota bacterium]
MSAPPTHGQIIGGLSTTPDLAAALCDYRDVLGLRLVETGALDAGLAAAWGCPASAGAAMAVLQPQSGAPCYLRLVEAPLPPDFRPTTSYGWGAFELTVQDVYGWPDRLVGSGFTVVGPPRALEGMPHFVPMQVIGRGGEMLYLNEVFGDSAGSDLPRAGSPVDRIFICILAARDRADSVSWYADRIGLDAGETFNLAYSMINKAFGLPADYRSDLTMVQKGRMTILEVDDYPPVTLERPGPADALPAGNALVSLAVDCLDKLDLAWITPPLVHPGALYGGRRSGTVRDPAGALLELVECGAVSG